MIPMKLKSSKIISLSDVLFTVIISAAGILIFALLGTNAAHDAVMVIVKQDGEVIASIPADTETLYEVNGAYRNVFQISNGEVSVRYTNCPDKSCERMGAIDSGGEVIVCAPNKVSVYIEGIDGEIDAYTG